MNARLKARLQDATKVALLGAAGLYGLLIFLYNMPYNPLSASLKPLTRATIGTYASQNWRLFAPNPTTSDVALVVGCVDAQTTEELSLKAELGEPVAYEGPWSDITLPLWKHHQHNRFSAYDRLSRPATNAARDYLQPPADLIPFGKSCEKGDERSCRHFERGIELSRLAAAGRLRRIASAYCRSVEPEAAAVAIRIRQTSAIPWSERNDPDAEREIQDGDVGVFPIDSTVMPAPMYGPKES